MKQERKALLGERLRMARIRARLSQKYVAQLMQVEDEVLVLWETGVAEPSATQLAELATIYCECAHRLLFGALFGAALN